MQSDDKSKKQEGTKEPFDRVAMAGLVRHMRLAATYSTFDEEYAKGFFAGWTTACGAILSALGESPSKWMKDEDR